MRVASDIKQCLATAKDTTPTENILENEDKLTAEGYRTQLVNNYSLKLPPDASRFQHDQHVDGADGGYARDWGEGGG